jgi:hypothetical protein
MIVNGTNTVLIIFLVIAYRCKSEKVNKIKFLYKTIEEVIMLSNFLSLENEMNPLFQLLLFIKYNANLVNDKHLNVYLNVAEMLKQLNENIITLLFKFFNYFSSFPLCKLIFVLHKDTLLPRIANFSKQKSCYVRTTLCNVYYNYFSVWLIKHSFNIFFESNFLVQFYRYDIMTGIAILAKIKC